MINAEAGWYIFLASVTFMVLAALVLKETRKQERFAYRFKKIWAVEKEGVEIPVMKGPLLLRWISTLGTRIADSGLLSSRTLAEFEETLSMAGYRRGNKLGLFLGCKLLMIILLPSLVLPLAHHLLRSPLLINGFGVAAAVIGLLAPDFIIRFLRSRHLRGVIFGLPDALDLMVICTDAGLGLEPSLARVASEIRPAHPSTADELSQISTELRITADARAAMSNAAKRTGLEEMKRLATTLGQSIKYGTPLSQALRTLAAEMRQETLTRFEARAAKLPAILTLPMIIFILPCVFIVVGGPAVLSALSTLK